MSTKISGVAQWVVANFNYNITDYELYAGLAPESICHPFVVYDIINDTPIADTCKDLSTYLIQFKCFDSEQNLATIYGIMDEIRDCFDDAQTTDPDYVIEMCQYNNSYMVRDAENQGWMGILEYQVWIH